MSEVQGEQTFEEMLDASMKSVKAGDVVEGTVLDVKPELAILNIGYKADAVLTRSEYSDDPGVDLTAQLHPGDKISVKVMRVNDGEGQVTVSYRQMAQERAQAKVKEAFEKGTVLTAPVSAVVKGGVNVMVEGLRIFIPASLLSDHYVKDLHEFAGKEVSFQITEFEPAKRRIIGNCRKVLEEQRKAAAEKLYENLRPGDVVEGTVSNIMDYGVFVDIGGADGLLHVSEMGWGHTGSPKKLFTKGQKLRVLVKEINGKKIALSLKFPDEDPWIAAADKYAVGSVVTGTVRRLADFGAFVELEPGVDGLLHVSQISRKRIEKPSDVLKVGDTVTAKIISNDPEKNRIGLSIRALEDDQERAKRDADRRAERATYVPGTEDDEAVTVDIDALIARQKAQEAAEAAAAGDSAAEQKGN